MIWPQSVVQPSRAGTCFANSGSDLIIYASILWEKAAQVAELQHNLQLFIADLNDRIARWAAWFRLKHHFGFFYADGEVSAQSSAKSSSCRSSKDTLVRAFRHWRLKIQPSLLNLIITPLLQFLKASWSIAEKMIQKSSRAMTQPCLVPFVTGKASDVVPRSDTRAIIPSWKWANDLDYSRWTASL